MASLSEQLFYYKDRKQMRISFNGILHLRIEYKRLRALQSWMEPVPVSDSYPEGVKYSIEYTFDTYEVLSEYSYKEHWIDVLKYMGRELPTNQGIFNE